LILTNKAIRQPGWWRCRCWLYKQSSHTQIYKYICLSVLECGAVFVVVCASLVNVQHTH